MPSTLVHACAANAFCFVTCIIWSMIIQWSVAFKTICLPFFLSQLPWGILAWQIVRTEFEKRPSLAQSFAFQMDLRNPSFCYGLLRVSMGFLRFGYGLEKPGFFPENQVFTAIHGFSTAYYGYSTGCHPMTIFGMIFHKNDQKCLQTCSRRGFRTNNCPKK